MKKLILTITTTALLAGTVNAQKFYIRAGGGYAMPLAGQTMNTFNEAPFNGSMEYNYATDVTTFETKPASFAAGGYAVLGAGYMFTSNIGAELNFFAGVAPKKYTSTYSESNSGSSISSTMTSRMQATMPILLNPAVKLQTGGNLNFYTRIGVLLPLKNGFKEEASGTDTDPGGSLSYQGKGEYKSKFGLGANGALGVSMKAISWLDIWAEANFNAMSVQASELTITEYTEDGANLLPYIDPNDLTVEFTTNGTDDDAEPSFVLPFSSIGIMAGVSIGL